MRKLATASAEITQLGANRDGSIQVTYNAFNRTDGYMITGHFTAEKEDIPEIGSSVVVEIWDKKGGE